MSFCNIGHNCDKCINLINQICGVMIIIDQLHRSVEFNFPPKRIISLVPSQSELLWYLGVKEELVGITKFCIHPNEMFQLVKRIGGTKTINIDEVKKLNPCLIIANKEEHEQNQIEELAKMFPVYISDIYNLNDASQMIEQIGIITDRENESKKTISSIIEKHQLFKNQHLKINQNKVTYLIWKNPYMAAGSNTFITSMLHEIGFENIFANHQNRYPEITVADLQEKQLDYLFLSSEPYPFKEKDIIELQEKLPDTKIILVDGEMFSWYGSRLLYAFDYFCELIRKLL